ncbi:MAG: hypothetical protein ACD_58C00059G0004 [uncultured bacterium]|nr:MAG: hypothetical protein ACD_58C00059G0004 [uncultured bacterium]
MQKTPTADVSGKIFFDFKYLPDNFIDRNIDEGITQTFLSNVFNKSYVYKYLSTTHNYSWVWDALNNDYTTDPVKHIYPDPGAYHEKVGANLVVEAKQTFPSVSLTSNLQEVCKSSTTGVKLTWASSNATKILSNNFGVNSLSGEATVFPTTDTNYSINVGDNRGNSASSSVYVFVKDCTTQNQTQANNSVFKGVFIGNEISLPNPNGRSMTIEYDSNIVNNPPPGFGDLIAPNWGERVP